jgi:hypothetical protein
MDRQDWLLTLRKRNEAALVLGDGRAAPQLNGRFASPTRKLWRNGVSSLSTVKQRLET